MFQFKRTTEVIQLSENHKEIYKVKSNKHDPISSYKVSCMIFIDCRTDIFHPLNINIHG